MSKYGKYHAKWKENIAKCTKYHATCKVTMPKCSKYHAKRQVLVPNCCKYKANGTGKESHSWHRGARASHDFLFGLPVPGQSVDPSTCHTAVSSWPWLGNLRSKAMFFPSEDPKVILKTLEYLGFFRKFLGSTWFHPKKCLN